MTGSCPVSARVCQETAKERDELRRWKAEALPVLDGMQELGRALGLPLGSRITGQEALAAVERLTRERDDDRRVADIAVDQKRRLLRERDEARAEVERLRAGIEALHRPVLPVFSWRDGLRFEEPCPECHGKAGVHPCGCWADEDTQYECLECAQPKGGGSRRVSPWPCPTAALLNPTEGDRDE